MNFRRGFILVAWTFFVILATGATLFVYTYGDCLDEENCGILSNRHVLLIGGIGFVLYWAVFIALVRRWSRDVF